MVLLRSLLLIILINVAYNLPSQVLEFRDISPSWSYSFKEKSTSDTTNHIYIFEIVEKDGKYIVFGASEEPSIYGDWYGANLACLNQEGNEEWYTSYQTFADNDSIHVFFPNLDFNASEIQLFGYRRKHEWTDTPGRTDSWALYGADEMYPHDIAIDLQSGTITEICAGEDTLTIGRNHTDVPTFKNEIGEILKTTNDVHLRPDSSLFDDKTTLGFNFYDYNNSCSFLESNIIDTILFLPDDTVKSLSVEMFPLRIQPDPNTLIVNIWFERFSDDPKQYLMWMDISDINDIQLIDMQELSAYIPRSTDRGIFLRFHGKNKQTFLSHSYNSVSGKACYLLWLNNDREVKKAITHCKVDGHSYRSMNLVHATDNELLCLGYPSRTTARGYDLLRVSEDEDSLIFIKSIIPKESKYLFSYESGTISENGEEIVLGMEVFEYQNNMKINQRREIHAFRLSDLTSSSFNPYRTSQHLSIYPNPTMNTVWFEDHSNIQNVMLRNVSGQQMSIDFQAGEDEIDVSHLPGGLYFLHAQDVEGNWYQSKLIKQ